LALRHGQDLLVGRSNHELATAVVSLIEQPDLAARLARHGRETIERRYAWDSNLPRLDAWLDLLAALPRRSKEIP
jgi:glycosyltransferase involved in cell wall biosynthesis